MARFGLVLLALSTLGLWANVLANVEKIVFIPQRSEAAEFPTGIPPPLFRLSPSTPRLRATLNTSFPDATGAAAPAAQGSATWVALDALTVGQRYEVRICWAATVRYIYIYTQIAELPPG